MIDPGVVDAPTETSHWPKAWPLGKDVSTNAVMLLPSELLPPVSQVATSPKGACPSGAIEAGLEALPGGYFVMSLRGGYERSQPQW